MNLTFACRSLLATIAVAGLAAQADAKLVKYHFTGTKIIGEGDIGTKISGTVTLDVGATPDTINPFSTSWDYRPNWDSFGTYSGYYQDWYNGGFSIHAVTDSGHVVGTFLDGDTVFYEYEEDWRNYDSAGSLERYQYHETNISYQGSGRYVELYGINNVVGGLVPGVVPNPWDPSRMEISGINIGDYQNFSSPTGGSPWGEFTLDSFTLVPTNIIIGGIDTGIVDFQYQGKLVSESLAEFAAAAKNHGDYVSRVAKLTNDLKKAGLLTGNQKGIIMDAAAKSSYGK